MSLRSARFAVLTTVTGLLFSLLTGCTVVPGTHTYDMREQSSVPMPTGKADEAVPAHVKVQPINAELIIDLDKRFKAEAETVKKTTDKSAQEAQDLIKDYKIGPGDIIQVTVWDHPELTIPAGSYRSAEQSGNVVSEDGTIFYPYVGTLKVAGKTTREVRSVLTQKLAKYIEKVQLDVRVIGYRSKRVYVVGEVKQPGQIDITDVPMTILDAVTKAGGFTPESDYSQVLLTRSNATWRVDLQALYDDGAIGQNVRLEPGDIVNVPDRSLNKVFVLGEVNKPGPYQMHKRRITLAEALANAGYVNETTSNPAWVFVMRGGSDKPELFHLNSKSPDALVLADRFPLQPRDIVYVDAAEVARWNRVITNVLPTANMLQTISTTQFPLLGGRQ